MSGLFSVVEYKTMANSARKMKPVLLSTVLLGTGMALSGCLESSSTGSTSDSGGGSVSTGGEHYDQANATLVFSAALPSSGDGAQVAYLNQLSSIEVRLFDSPVGSWDDFWEDSDYGYFDEYNLIDGLLRNADYDFGWESGYHDRVSLTADNSEGRLAVAPGEYILVARGWRSDQDMTEDPAWAQSAALLELQPGEHQVALNLLTASWDIEGGPIDLELLTKSGFDWNPDQDGEQTAAQMLGLDTGEIHGFHMLPPIIDQDYFSQGGRDLLSYLSSTTVYRKSTADGRDGVLEPGSGDYWQDGSTVPDGVNIDVWWDIEHSAVIGQDYSSGTGNRARVSFPEVWLEAEDYIAGEAEDSEWAFRQASLFSLGEPLFGVDAVLEVSNQDWIGEEDYWVEHTGSVCIDEGDSQPRCIDESQVISYWGVEDQVNLPADIDMQSYALGEVVSGNSIETTLVEILDSDWSVEQMEELQPPQIDLDFPLGQVEEGYGDGSNDNSLNVNVTNYGHVAELSSKRGHHQPSRRQMLKRALYEHSTSAAVASLPHGKGNTAVSAAESRCADIDWSYSSYNVSYVWDPEHNNGAGGWRSGTFMWSENNLFEVGKYWGVDHLEKGDTFYAWAGSGTFEACLHPITLQATDVSTAVRQAWEMEAWELEQDGQQQESFE